MVSEQNQMSTFKSGLYQPRFEADWEKHTLYELAKWVNGLAFRNIHFTATGKPVIKIAEIKNGISGQTKFTEGTYDQIYHVTEGDMVFSWSGQPETSIDVFRWRGPDGWLNQHIFKVYPSRKCQENYFFYLLKYLNPNFVRIARNKQTTGLGHVTKKDIQNILVRLPAESEQRAIAHILGSLDDKIELNRQMNKTLEAMAQAIFKSWFVDFNPVHAKAAGRDPGLPNEIATLFPDSFEDSDLGEIPKGWEVKILSEICKKPQYGFTASAQNEVVGPKFLRIKDINKSDWIDWNMVPYCEIEQKNKRKYKLQPGDIVIARIADPGHTAFIEEPVDAVFASYLIRFRLLNPTYNRYFQYWLRSDVYWSLVRGRQSGSTRANLNAKVLGAFPVLVPNPDLAKYFKNYINPISNKVVRNVNESRTLGALRDTLLPKLISGEICVPDAEKFVEEAGV